jgi:FkbM family methyltransferase
MFINHLAQADIQLLGEHRRFWMDTCAGRDQVAMTLLEQGWKAYEAPLPTLVAQWCQAIKPVFIDVGANTGFYSLLALACGARAAHAFEPVAEIAGILEANMRVSELSGLVTLHPVALGADAGVAMLYFPRADHGLIETSASLNSGFRAQHSARREVQVARLDACLPLVSMAGRDILLKIDVESREADVLRGATELLKNLRPAIVAELLPGVDLAWFEQLCLQGGYSHYALQPAGPVKAFEMIASERQRDHLFLPQEAAERWLGPLSPP